MCSIAGIMNLPFNEKVCESMHNTMYRRGPDQRGIFQQNGQCLLHSRLSIIDPAGGIQPMHYEEYVIVYNGELYNTDEVRRELIKDGYCFTTTSDTEVILKAYAHWGQSVLSRLNGIFGFAILNIRTGALFLARDRIGVKPLFYTIYNNGLIFASEIKTILAYPDVEPILDINGISQLLLLGPGRISGSGVFKDIMELKPGHFAYWDKGRFYEACYWKLTDREHTENFEETAEQVRFLVQDAIRRQTVSDVPLGTFLSGGLDSSIITAVCSDIAFQKGKQLDTFSVDYQNNDRYFVPGKFQPNADSTYIQKMVREKNTNHHSTVLTTEDLMEALETATRARDLPGMADVDFSLLCLCKDVRSHVKVALSGECADEIFGGYPWYRDPEVRALDGFPWAQNTAYRAGFINNELRTMVDPEAFVMDQYLMTVQRSDILPDTDPENKRIKQMVNLNFNWFMQTLLDRKDRMSMYNSLEVRVPFCDHRIAEYLYGVPWEYKEHRGMEKGLLRYAVKDILPEEILYRKKSPYPKTFDPKYMELVSGQLMELLQQPDAPVFSLVNPKAVRSLLSAEYVWPWYGQLMKVPQTIAYILQIDHWLRTYQVKIRP